MGETQPADQTVPQRDRVIRVFVSSTFRDMHAERELLVKEVFPALRRKCAKPLVTFAEVDLRWGITDEQAAEGQVLPLGLSEIERSRRYFLGLERQDRLADVFESALDCGEEEKTTERQFQPEMYELDDPRSASTFGGSENAW